MDRSTAARKARAFARLAGHLVGGDQAYLFGPCADGTARQDSDLDVATIVPSLKGDYLEGLTRLYRLRSAVDVRIEPHLVVQDLDPLGFSQEIERTGFPL